MKSFGFEIKRSKALAPSEPRSIYSPGWMGNSSWWWNIIQEPFTGAWQRNMEWRLENVLTYFAVYSCITLIASDIAKLRIRLMQEDEDGIGEETESSSFSPVLRKPNHYQTRIQFIQNWLTSKLTYGNAYILKERDERNIVTRMYVLDPSLTRPMIAPDGSVFYQLGTDQLAGLENSNVVVPASEIIHDVMNPLYHPLCGVSPISACGLAALQGLNIQNNSAKFFAQGSKPGGILTAPALIHDETAKRLKDEWEQNYSGANVGKIAVLGDGLEYKPITMTASDSQLIAQLKWTAENVCSCFHVPNYMIGVGPPPNYSNIEALNQQYYSQCLQIHVESVETLLDEGLGLTAQAGRPYRTEFDLDELLRMDTRTKVSSWSDLVKSGIAAPDEARAQFNLGPTEGGKAPYLQQQNYSLEDLSKRSAKEDPFATTPKPTATPPKLKPPQEEAEPAPPKMLPMPSVWQRTAAILKEVAQQNAAT